MQPLVKDIVAIMEAWAPAWSAESWDRVGLLAGNPQAPAGQVLVALEISPRILDQALKDSVDLILTHHPPLFKPLANLRTDNPATARLIKAAAGGISLFAAHTNLDMAPGGVNDALAEALGMEDAAPLEGLERGLAKLVVFVPAQDRERVSQAIFAAGAGRVGDYRDCWFAVPGQGGYLAPPGGNPAMGQPGERSQVDELRLESVIPADSAGRVVRALLEAHPYEEPAFDIYPLGQGPAGFGLGRVGELDRAVAGPEFLRRVTKKLGATAPAFAGPLPEKVSRVAVMSGSGGEYLPQAAAAGAQVLITGEARYHQFEQAGDLGVCLAVMGHYQTEAVIVEPWARRLARELKAAGFECNVNPVTGGRDPWRPVADL